MRRREFIAGLPLPRRLYRSPARLFRRRHNLRIKGEGRHSEPWAKDNRMLVEYELIYLAWGRKRGVASSPYAARWVMGPAVPPPGARATPELPPLCPLSGR
jgi:hypothetical protein